MNRTLILTRHAKSDWSDPRLVDHDRPLNGRGRRSAALLGQWMHRAGWIPGEAIVSTAVRARQTWEGIAAQLEEAPEPRVMEELYHAWPDRILTALRRAQAPTVILIGHNPGIAAAAQQFLVVRPRHERFADYPTGATTVIRFHAHFWHEVGWEAGEALDFVIPRELD